MSDRTTPERFFAGMRAIGAEDALAVQNLRRVREAGGRIVLATDAGNPLTCGRPDLHQPL